LLPLYLPTTSLSSLYPSTSNYSFHPISTYPGMSRPDTPTELIPGDASDFGTDEPGPSTRRARPLKRERELDVDEELDELLSDDANEGGEENEALPAEQTEAQCFWDTCRLHFGDKNALVRHLNTGKSYGVFQIIEKSGSFFFIHSISISLSIVISSYHRCSLSFDI
jgi:hypothetical protein